MKVISFTIEAARLIEIFTACVNYFNYIRIGRRLGRDYKTLVIKLDFI